MVIWVKVSSVSFFCASLRLFKIIKKIKEILKGNWEYFLLILEITTPQFRQSGPNAFSMLLDFDHGLFNP